MKRLRWLSFAVFSTAVFIAGCVPPTTGPVNNPPVVVVSATPTSGTVPLTVDFSSAGTLDPEGSALTYSWNFGDGSPLVTSADPTHTYTGPGTFTAVLTVRDAQNAPGTKSVLITVSNVPNVPPVAAISSDTTSGKEALTVNFDGSGSSDADGTIAAYAWAFGDGGTSSQQSPTHTFSDAGNYTVSLTVTDDDGDSNTATTVIEVTPNQPPTVVANGSPGSGKEPLTVDFSSAGTTDPDGTITGYSWAFGDGGTSTDANPTHTYTSFGNFTATLTVTDDNGDTGTNTVSTSVVANQPPVAVANGTPTGGIVPLTVVFTGSGSNDPDGTITDYLWTFGDGTFSNFPNPTHTYGAVGTYTATLQVTDDNGVTNTASLTIEVNGVPNVPPTAAASGTPTSGKVPLTVSFSSAGSTDSDGSIIGYAWDFGDGTGSSLANPSHVYTTAGPRTATLTVTDNSGATNTATVNVTVNPNQAPTAVASGTPTTGKEPLTVAFSSALSSDPDGSLVSRTWDFGDGGSSSSANPSHVYTSAGNYVATLTVTDDNGAQATATVNVTVNANQAPTAVLNATPQSGRRPLVVSFDSSSSVDPDGTIVSRSLDFGDGSPTSTASSTTHTYAVGTWTATQSVTDDNGVTRTASKVITVFIDDDNDGVQPPSDCNDTDNSTYPGAPDALDANGTDQNCDGVDGTLSDSILVAPTGSDASGCGLAVSTPCQTLPNAVSRAAATGRHVILVAAGPSFGGFSLTSVSNLTVRGGYGSDFASRSGTTTATSGVNVTSSTGIVLRDLTLVGPGGTNTTAVVVSNSTVALNGITAQSGTPTGVGSSAYGVRALQGSTVTIQNSNITAAPGVAGTAGSTPTAGLTAGVNGASGSNGANHAVPSGANGGSGINNGGRGGNGDGQSGTAGTNGGGGGAGGCNNCRSNSNYSGGGAAGGAGGASGATGSHGGGGQAAYGSFFTPTAASNGGTGANGGGGGGGGGGGRACDATFCAGQWTGGGAGGGGGGGGQGGGGGTAGTAAGGSFAVYAQNSTVTIDGNTTLTTGNGGSGGAGAIGQAGASGGVGGSGGSGVKADCCTGTGGSGGGGGGISNPGGGGGDGSAGTCCNGASGGGGGGGGGGNGGRGGSGGGGAGGPSVAMLNKGSGSITFGGNLTSQVTIGAGGSGGTSPNGGNAGANGAAAKQLNVA